jgi:tRNA (guanine37-N1)-methyltransferase
MARSRHNRNETSLPHKFEALPGSYDVIGDVAVLRVPDHLASQKRRVAEAVMEAHRRVKAVFCQVGGVNGEFRLRGLVWVLGEERKATVHKESGCLFKVDLGKCYFSPRLSFERLRVVRSSQPDEVVVNMFAGVGCFSILMAKLGGARKVYFYRFESCCV